MWSRKGLTVAPEAGRAEGPRRGRAQVHVRANGPAASGPRQP